MNKQSDIKVLCPTCKQHIEWRSDNPFRPFCCERCKLIDLGEWASESHKIPGEPASFEDHADNDNAFH